MEQKIEATLESSRHAAHDDEQSRELLFGPLFLALAH